MNQFIFSFPGSFRDFLFPRNISPLIQAIGREANRANQKLGQYSDTNNLLSFVRTKTNLPIDCLFLQNILTMLTVAVKSFHHQVGDCQQERHEADVGKIDFCFCSDYGVL